MTRETKSTTEQLASRMVSHKLWRDENLPSDEMMEIVRAIQQLSATALAMQGIRLVAVTFDKLPEFNPTKGRGTGHAAAIAGDVEIKGEL